MVFLVRTLSGKRTSEKKGVPLSNKANRLTVGCGVTDFNTAMLEDFHAYHPDLKHVIKIAGNVTCWPLSIHDPLTSWTKGKVVLVGDAAHPVSVSNRRRFLGGFCSEQSLT